MVLQSTSGNEFAGSRLRLKQNNRKGKGKKILLVGMML